MDDLNFYFDAAAHKKIDNPTGEPVPAGWYKCVIEEITKHPVKDKPNSAYLKIVWKIEGSEAFNGRKVFQLLNLWSDYPDTAEKAHSHLKQIVESMVQFRGTNEFKDANEIKGYPVNLKLKVRPAEGGFKPSNGIEEYSPYGTIPSISSPQQPTAAAPTSIPTSAPTSAPPPFQKQPTSSGNPMGDLVTGA